MLLDRFGLTRFEFGLFGLATYTKRPSEATYSVGGPVDLRRLYHLESTDIRDVVGFLSSLVWCKISIRARKENGLEDIGNCRTELKRLLEREHKRTNDRTKRNRTPSLSIIPFMSFV